MAELRRIMIAWRFARRRMRHQIKSFGVFLACLILGVATIGGINGIAQLINDALTSQGKIILGGDLRVALNQQPASQQELLSFEALGQVSACINMRSMVRNQTTGDQSLAEIKAVDNRYPLYGKLATTPGFEPRLLENDGGYFGAIVAPYFLRRLRLKIGDAIEIGRATFIVRGVIKNEPDLLSETFLLGQRLFIAREAMPQTGLVAPGSLLRYVYKIAIGNIDDAALENLADGMQNRSAETGWRITTRINASPLLRENVANFVEFLALIGLACLMIGGLGIYNGVATYLARKKREIAIFKALGATSNFITLLFIVQIMIFAFIGIIVGLSGAIALPILVAHSLSNYLPIAHVFVIFPKALLIAAIYALLTILAFTLPTFGRVGKISTLNLLSITRDNDALQPSNFYRLTSFICFVAIIMIAIADAHNKTNAILFLLSFVAIWFILRGLAFAIIFGSKQKMTIYSPCMRLALGNIHRHGKLTSTIVVALGLSLTMAVGLVTVELNLRHHLSATVPKSAPDYFFLDITNQDADRFSAFLNKFVQSDKVEMAPALRARITAINDRPANKIKVTADSRWVLNSDRAISYARSLPASTKIVAGKWWGKYDEDNLVSISAREARALNIKIGDHLTVNVLGRSITATVANLRDVNWDSLSLNFVLIFSPSSLEDAPHGWIATTKFAHSSLQRDGDLMRQLGREFPTVTAISVRDALDNAQEIVNKIIFIIRALTAIAFVITLLVLAGAFTARNEQRTREAMIMKTLGATRLILLRSLTYEYLIIGMVTALFSYCGGSFAGYAIAKNSMGIATATISTLTALEVIVWILLLSIGLGLINLSIVLGKKPARLLEDD